MCSDWWVQTFQINSKALLAYCFPVIYKYVIYCTDIISFSESAISNYMDRILKVPVVVWWMDLCTREELEPHLLKINQVQRHLSNDGNYKQFLPAQFLQHGYLQWYNSFCFYVDIFLMMITRWLALSIMFALYASSMNKYVLVFFTDFKNMGLQLHCRAARKLKRTTFCLDIQVFLVLL